MYEKERQKLIDALAKYDISDRVRKAIYKVPRHLFVPSDVRKWAYADRPLPIGHKQTISAPHMVAMMCHYLDPMEGDTVLEIGTGCGYHAAVLAELVGKNGCIVSIERVGGLVHNAEKNLQHLGYDNVVKVVEGDGTLGYPE